MIASAAFAGLSPIGIFEVIRNCNVASGFEFIAFRIAGTYFVVQLIINSAGMVYVLGVH